MRKRMKILSKKLTEQVRKWVLNVSAALLPACAFGQADIHFSQFYEESILRNPALTGVFSKDYKFGAYYRSQWATISNPYNTFLGSAETHFQVRQSSEDFVSIGLLAYYDKAGSIDQKITGVYPAINYNKSLNADKNRFLSFGFTGGYLQYSFDPSKATFNNQFQNGKYNAANPALENLPNAKMNLWDLGAGINYNSSAGAGNQMTYIIGFSGYHFTQPKFSYYQKEGITENMRLNGNASIGWNLQDNLTSQLHVNYAMQGTYRELLVGGIVNWTQATQGIDEVLILSGGLFYRYQDAIIPVIKVAYRSLAFGLSYDVNISTLQEASLMQGGYEFTLFYTGDFIDRGIQKKTVCPKF